MYQAYQYGHFDKWPDYSGKGLTAVQSKYADCNSNSQFKVISRSGERYRCVLIVSCPCCFTCKKADKKHYHKVD